MTGMVANVNDVAKQSMRGIIGMAVYVNAVVKQGIRNMIGTVVNCNRCGKEQHIWMYESSNETGREEAYGMGLCGKKKSVFIVVTSVV
jgi:hypothetical protein